MKALVIGYGSIGQRHTTVLKEMGLEVSVVSRRYLNEAGFYSSIEDALKANSFEYIVIANETAAHFDTLQSIVKEHFTGKILVEKPLFLKDQQFESQITNTYVAYNLRYHPLFEKVRTLLADEQVTNVNAYVGQYLPSWRPNTDYSKGYSASSEQGGGVLRDLSHELDYLTLLFGEWQELVASCSKVSDLKIQSEDHVQVMYQTKQANTRVSVELNYLDRIIQRYMIIQTNTKTIRVDFISNSITCNGELLTLDSLDRNYTYQKQHEDVLNDVTLCCSFDEGLKVMKMINAIEKSSNLKEWVYND